MAVVEHTNYMPKSHYQGKHLVYVGNYLSPSHPLLTQAADSILEEYTPYLQRINPLFTIQWVKELWAFSAPFAQPIVTTNFRMHIPLHDLPIRILYMANMFQIYPQDRDRTYSIAMAERLARRLR